MDRNTTKRHKRHRIILSHLPPDCMRLIGSFIGPFACRMFSMVCKCTRKVCVNLIDDNQQTFKKKWTQDLKFCWDDLDYEHGGTFIDFFIEADSSFFRNVEVMSHIFTRRNTNYNAPGVWYLIGTKSRLFIKNTIEYFATVGLPLPELTDRSMISHNDYLNYGIVDSNNYRNTKLIEEKVISIHPSIIERLFRYGSVNSIRTYMKKTGLQLSGDMSLLNYVVQSNTFEVCEYLFENGCEIGPGTLVDLCHYPQFDLMYVPKILGYIEKKLLILNNSDLSDEIRSICMIALVKGCIIHNKHDIFTLLVKIYKELGQDEKSLNDLILRVSIEHNNFQMTEKLMDTIGLQYSYSCILGNNQKLFDKIVHKSTLEKITKAYDPPNTPSDENIHIVYSHMLAAAITSPNTHFVRKIMKMYAKDQKIKHRHHNELFAPILQNLIGMKMHKNIDHVHIESLMYLVDKTDLSQMFKSIICEIHGRILTTGYYISNSSPAIFDYPNNIIIKFLFDIIHMLPLGDEYRSIINTCNQLLLAQLISHYISFETPYYKFLMHNVTALLRQEDRISFDVNTFSKASRCHLQKIVSDWIKLMCSNPDVIMDIEILCERGYQLTKKDVNRLLKSDNPYYASLIGKYYKN